MWEKATIGELVMAIGIAIVVLIGVTAISHMDTSSYADPRWVSAAAELAQMVFTLYLLFWVWRLNHNVNVIMSIICGDKSYLNPSLAGVLKLAVQKFKEEAQAIKEELEDG